MFRQSYLFVAILPLVFVAACGDKDTDIYRENLAELDADTN